MTINYTDLLKLSKPVAGTESGGWGDILNDQVTEMVEEAIAGLTVHNMTSDANYTLTTANGATSQARNMMVEITDTDTNLTAGKDIIVPGTSKMYIFKNGTAQVLTVKVSGQSGVAVPAGKTMLLHCDGTNVEEGINQIVGNLAIGGTAAITGTTTSTGDFTVGANKVTMAASSGNTVIAGTLTTSNGALTTGSGSITTTGAVSYSPALKGDALQTGTSLSTSDMVSAKGRRIIYTTSSNHLTVDLPTTGSNVTVGDTWTFINAQATKNIVLTTASDDKIDVATGSAYTPGSANGNKTIGPGGLAEISVLSIATNVITYILFGSGIT